MLIKALSSKVLVEYYIAWSFCPLTVSKINIYIRNKIVIIERKTSPLLNVWWLELSPLIEFCSSAVVCYIVAFFLFFFTLLYDFYIIFLSDYSTQQV